MPLFWWGSFAILLMVTLLQVTNWKRTAATTSDCFVQSILTAADVLRGLAYMETYRYLVRVAVGNTSSSGACEVEHY